LAGHFALTLAMSDRPVLAQVSESPSRSTRNLAGWTVHVSESLLATNAIPTAHALDLIQAQLEEIVRVVPAPAVIKLQKVPLWISPEYPGIPPRAEYHPDSRWLRAHGRDPAMAHGVEFTNVRIIEAECRRMPMLVLHELAHSYHDLVLGNDYPAIRSAYEKAKVEGNYDRVERCHGDGRPNTFERAYAMTNEQEYFAENSEAFFGRNDFFPFNREELARHDPGMFEVLKVVWGVGPQLESPKRKTAAAINQTPVDFNHPPREYVTREFRGWSVMVEKQLIDEAPDLAKATLARLEKKLGEAVEVLPSAALPDLRQLKIFLMYGPPAKGGGRTKGLEYFRAHAAIHQDWLAPEMERSVVIYNADNYAKLSEFWALKSLIHEFGHAQHLEHWPEDRADIYDAWDHAIKTGLYQVIRAEDLGTHNPNYAAQNHLEYFAELTATYFVGNNYFPRDRAGLKEYDPAGYALIETIWNVRSK
jgi:Mlc titration factor MtfA (ptsG expression regulator)